MSVHHLSNQGNAMKLSRQRPANPHRVGTACALLSLALSAAFLLPGTAHAVRIKEIAAVQGVRGNQLTGFGLVVGLDGTGDQTTQMPYTSQGLMSYLQQLGITLPPGSNSQLQLKNVAAVIVTAQLPAFAQPGQMLDINVSSMGNAKSLRGRIPDGAQVERSVPTSLQQGDTIQLDLNAIDFQTARRVAQVVNQKMGPGLARALDGRAVQVKAPTDPDQRVTFLAEIEELSFDLAVPAAKVVINARTGSIVMNQAITLNPCAVAHGNLSVSISSTPVISQPNALSSGGQTVVTEKTNIQIKQEPGVLIQLPAATQLSEVVRALNALGATPQDLLAILQAIKSAGALNADLEVI